jgi:thioredoxin-related protein
VAVQAPAAAQGTQEREPIYDESTDAQADIDAALARAKKEHKRVLIQWGGNWCGWCYKLHDLFEGDREIATKLDYEYEVVYVDIGHGDKNLDVSDRLQADHRAHGYPYLTILDAAGKVVIHKDTAELEEGDHHDPALVLAFLTEYQAEPLDARHIISTAATIADRQGKRIFLHIGAPWCSWCARLERWLDRPKVKEIWAKDFLAVKIDQDRMANADAVMAEFPQSTRAGGIPWFVVVDPRTGETPYDSLIMPEGRNIGFPWRDDELAAFEEWLAEACISITPEEQQVLIAEIEAQKKEEEAAAGGH